MLGGERRVGLGVAQDVGAGGPCVGGTGLGIDGGDVGGMVVGVCGPGGGALERENVGFFKVIEEGVEVGELLAAAGKVGALCGVSGVAGRVGVGLTKDWSV